jgi:hypothetical protein
LVKNYFTIFFAGSLPNISRKPSRKRADVGIRIKGENPSPAGI